MILSQGARLIRKMYSLMKGQGDSRDYIFWIWYLGTLDFPRVWSGELRSWLKQFRAGNLGGHHLARMGIYRTIKPSITVLAPSCIIPVFKGISHIPYESSLLTVIGPSRQKVAPYYYNDLHNFHTSHSGRRLNDEHIIFLLTFPLHFWFSAPTLDALHYFWPVYFLQRTTDNLMFDIYRIYTHFTRRILHFLLLIDINTSILDMLSQIL